MRILRKAEKKDLNAIGLIEENAFADRRKHVSVELAVNEGLCWIMLDKKREIGFITVDFITKKDCHIGIIAVMDSARRKGAASFMINYLAQEFAGRRLLGTTAVTNTSMAGAFMKCGFELKSPMTASELVFEKIPA
jgi:N-acetylglutamate synthase-like GNAT family acetyltransferase